MDELRANPTLYTPMGVSSELLKVLFECQSLVLKTQTSYIPCSSEWSALLAILESLALATVDMLRLRSDLVISLRSAGATPPNNSQRHFLRFPRPVNLGTFSDDDDDTDVIFENE